MLSEQDLKRAEELRSECSPVTAPEGDDHTLTWYRYRLLYESHVQLLDEVKRLKKHCKAWNFAMDEIVSTIRMTQDLINGKAHDQTT